MIPGRDGRGGGKTDADHVEGVAAVRIRTTVEYLIEEGERDIDAVIQDAEDLLAHLRAHKQDGHTTADVRAGFPGRPISVAVTAEAAPKATTEGGA